VSHVVESIVVVLYDSITNYNYLRTSVTSCPLNFRILRFSVFKFLSPIVCGVLILNFKPSAFPSRIGCLVEILFC